MTMKRKPLVVGNWKMHGSLAGNAELLLGLRELLPTSSVESAVCPPFVYLPSVGAALAGSAIELGAQDVCEQVEAGAYTGEVSASMLREIGCRYVIVGHSERRQHHGETDAIVAAKAAAVCRAGLIPIICVGESLAERDAGQTLAVVRGQLAGSVPEAAASMRTIIAYEPVWAIGTGRTPTLAQVAEVHEAMFETLTVRFGAAGASMSLLYGGSVKPENAAELMQAPGVDGALVGGASLKAADFLKIAAACA